MQWLDEPERYKTYLSILGQKHTMYEAEPRFMDQMGLMFITAVKPLLEKEVSEACFFLKKLPFCALVPLFRPPPADLRGEAENATFRRRKRLCMDNEKHSHPICEALHTHFSLFYILSLLILF